MVFIKAFENNSIDTYLKKLSSTTKNEATKPSK